MTHEQYYAAMNAQMGMGMGMGGGGNELDQMYSAAYNVGGGGAGVFCTGSLLMDVKFPSVKPVTLAHMETRKGTHTQSINDHAVLQVVGREIHTLVLKLIPTYTQTHIRAYLMMWCAQAVGRTAVWVVDLMQPCTARGEEQQAWEQGGGREWVEEEGVR